MERRGVVEKSRGLQGGRTDERITPELSPVAPWLRASVETKSTNQAGWQAGRLVGQAQVQVRIHVQVSVCPGRSQAKAVVQLGAGWEGVGGWEIGMSELAGGQEAGWTLAAGGVCRVCCGQLDAPEDAMQVGCNLQGESAPGSKVSRECFGIDQC